MSRSPMSIDPERSAQVRSRIAKRRFTLGGSLAVLVLAVIVLGSLGGLGGFGGFGGLLYAYTPTTTGPTVTEEMLLYSADGNAVASPALEGESSDEVLEGGLWLSARQ